MYVTQQNMGTKAEVKSCEKSKESLKLHKAGKLHALAQDANKVSVVMLLAGSEWVITPPSSLVLQGESNFNPGIQI